MLKSLKKLCVAAAILACAAHSLAEPTLEVDIASSAFTGRTILGEVRVREIGAVSLSARRDGSRIVVLASDASGRVIGRGESVAGLPTTPLHLRASQGLVRILVRWGSVAGATNDQPLSSAGPDSG